MGKEPNSPIAHRNDSFRKHTLDIVVTSGVQALPDVWGLEAAVRTFDSFNEDNDPYGEHDFGAIDWHGVKTYWKIDYYDQKLQKWCDPLSADCQRVLTILLASEW